MDKFSTQYWNSPHAKDGQLSSSDIWPRANGRSVRANVGDFPDGKGLHARAVAAFKQEKKTFAGDIIGSFIHNMCDWINRTA